MLKFFIIAVRLSKIGKLCAPLIHLCAPLICIKNSEVSQIFSWILHIGYHRPNIKLNVQADKSSPTELDVIHLKLISIF